MFRASLLQKALKGADSMRWLARQWPVLLWAALIWILSTHWFTAGNTSRIIFPILRFLFPHASRAFLIHAHGFIRKCGHVTVYFVFSLLLLRAIRNGRPGFTITWALAVILIVFAYACVDELHQSFVPGRGVEFSDVLLDTAAGTFAQILAGLWIAGREKRISERHRG
ncbi:MAG TPA: VanZ family protein [Candidatus Acidoferrales bacterium]|nr:VanZ family protein [Candidatus Acidoferrales bacterium]